MGCVHPVLLLTLIASVCSGQEVRPFRWTVGSEHLTFEVVAAKRCSPVAVGTLRRAAGGERVWQRALVNNPSFAKVEKSGQWVITVAGACGDSREHAIVLYDRAGNPVRDLPLHDVLTNEESRRFCNDDNGARCLWRIGTRFQFEASQIWAELPWGRRVPILNGPPSN